MCAGSAEWSPSLQPLRRVSTARGTKRDNKENATFFSLSLALSSFLVVLFRCCCCRFRFVSEKGGGSVRVFRRLMILLCHVLSFFLNRGLLLALRRLSQVSVLFRKREGVHDSTHMCQRSVIHVVALPRVPMLPFSLSFFSAFRF